MKKHNSQRTGRALEQMANLIEPTETVAVAAAIKLQGLHVFSSPEKFANLHSPKIPFHSLGGRCFKREHWPKAVIREIREETGKELSIVSASRTRLVTSSGMEGLIELADQPRPFCLYKRSNEHDDNFHHRRVRWLVGYLGKIDADALAPMRELAFLLLLTDAALARTAREPVSYRELARYTDGSCIVVKRGFKLDWTKVAAPEGLALLLAQKPHWADNR